MGARACEALRNDDDDGIELDTPCAEPGAEQPRTRPCVRAPTSRSVASCERRSAAQVQDRLRWLIGPTARRLADSFSAAGPSRGVLEMSTVHETRRPGCCSPRCWPASIGKCHGHDVDKMVSPRYPRVEPTYAGGAEYARRARMRVGEQAGADSTHASPAAWRGRHQALGAAAGNGRQERTDRKKPARGNDRPRLMA